jgi:hypothetical protein
LDQIVSERFYDEMRKRNGGQLPDDLRDPREPCRVRPLTKEPRDAEYRRVYREIYNNAVRSQNQAMQAAFQPAGAAVMTCTPGQPCPPQRQPCLHRRLTVKCGHAAHDYQLLMTSNLDGPATTQGIRKSGGAWLPPPVLEVVAGDVQADRIELTAKLDQGPCDRHKGNRIFDAPRIKPVLQSDNALAFEARFHKYGFWESLWPAHVKPVVHKISLHTCRGDPYHVTVHVYPDITWDAKLSLAFDTTKSLRHIIDEQGRERFKPGDLSLLTIDAKLKRTWNGKSEETGTSDPKLRQTTRLCEWIWEKICFFLPRFLDLLGTKFTMKSKVELSGNWGWKEIPGSWRCGFGGKVKISLKPLLEISIEQDVTDALLKALAAIPAVSPVALKLIELRETCKRLRREYEQAEEQEPAIPAETPSAETPEDAAARIARNRQAGMPAVVGQPQRYSEAEKTPYSEERPMDPARKQKLIDDVGSASSRPVDKAVKGARMGYFFGGVYLIVTGSVGFDAEWAKPHDGNEWNTGDCSANTSIEFQVLTRVEAKFKGQFWRVETSSSAVLEAGAKAGLKAENIKAFAHLDQLFVECKLTFTGLTVRGIASVNGNVRMASKTPPPPAAPVGTHTEESKTGNTTETVKRTDFQNLALSAGRAGGLNPVAAANAAWKEGVTYEKKKTVEDKEKNEQGYEYTKVKKETTTGVSAMKGGGVTGKASASFEWVVIPPKVWNYTDRPDPALPRDCPRGAFLVYPPFAKRKEDPTEMESLEGINPPHPAAVGPLG